MTSPDDDATSTVAPVAASYAEAIAELDRLLAAIEADEPDIDALAADVARAADLIEFCRGRIRNAESRVQEIVAGLGDEDPAPSSPPGVDVAQ